MLKIINKFRKTLFYGMAISAIINSVGINTRCDPPKQHAMHTKNNEHTINKLGFMYVNQSLVCKETVNEPDIVGDVGNEDTHAEPSVAPSVSLSVSPSVASSYPSMSTAFDSEQAFSRLLSYMESMDVCVVNRLDALEA
ncbi:Uncharacterized protein TCM_010774 [Theobroma cacao]|uniref:Uncharacterized protein n=1 Tax=Theobroma cacao TaxID=3641 RepID=A0A061E872_THECC|nr:Uncharacterized protein TCM_010774 [Theobroma cacao]